MSVYSLEGLLRQGVIVPVTESPDSSAKDRTDALARPEIFRSRTTTELETLFEEAQSPGRKTDPKPSPSSAEKPKWRPKSRCGSSSSSLSSPSGSPVEMLMDPPPLFVSGRAPKCRALPRFYDLATANVQILTGGQTWEGGKATVLEVQIGEKKRLLKVVSKSNRDAIFQEARCLAAAQDQNISEVVSFHGIVENVSWKGQEKVGLLMGWGGTSLAARFKNKKPFSREELMSLATGLSRAMKGLSEIEFVSDGDVSVGNGLLHGDFAPANVGFEETKVALFDFEQAALSGDVVPETRLPTPGYVAPETLLGEKSTIQSEMWAVGAILFEAATGQPLLDLKICEEELLSDVAAHLVARVEQEDWKARLDETLPGEDLLKQLIIDLVQIDPLKRPTAEAMQSYLLSDAIAGGGGGN